MRYNGLMRYIIIAVILFSGTAAASTYEMAVRQQQLCKTHGQMAVWARTNKAEALEQVRDSQVKVSNGDNARTHRLIVQSMSAGVNARPSLANSDLYMQVWAACMDYYD